ncbi:MAG: hypothetical protein NVSMB9_06380 [Isosphaeraceae bacterium]
MATAIKKASAALPSAEMKRVSAPSLLFLVSALDSVYRFLASLKLAVISLSTLAAVLAYATFFEKWYGAAAVQEWIYQSKGFAILLAFLAANILCAALIRYPWKKRQTGFVITHAGLLVLLAGSWYSVMTSDEGQVAALESEVKDEFIRNDYPIVRIKQVDPQDPATTLREWELPFRPGAFAWGPGLPKPGSVFSSLLAPFHGVERNPREVLTRPNDAFQFVVKSHIPASVPALLRQPDPAGVPMLKLRPSFKAPGMPEERELFVDDQERWFSTDKRLYKSVKSEGPAQFAFLVVDRPELVEEFLNPPPEAGNDGVARFRYKDSTGKTRSYDWALDGQAGKSFTLPESDFQVKFLNVVGFPAGEAGLGETLGESTIPIAEFEVRQGEKAPVKHFALASLPMFPNVIPAAREKGEPATSATPLVEVRYFLPPLLDPKANGRFGLVEVLGTPDGSLYYRVFGRGDAGKTRGQVRAKGPLKKGKKVLAFGGQANLPMSLSFEVEEYLPAGVAKPIYEPIFLPANRLNEGISASLVEMTVPDPVDPTKTATKEFYIHRSATHDAVWESVSFPNAQFQIAYDTDRKPLGFDLKMVDFQRGFDPGTEKASRFSSDVLLTDKTMGLVKKPIHISMNEPLTHRGYTFYQSSFVRERDPRTHRETGRVLSVLQVGLNPGRKIIYLGSLLIVLGAFVQFYMRAGLFTDGGKREREKMMSRAAKRARAHGDSIESPANPLERPFAQRSDEVEEPL